MRKHAAVAQAVECLVLRVCRLSLRAREWRSQVQLLLAALLLVAGCATQQSRQVVPATGTISRSFSAATQDCTPVGAACGSGHAACCKPSTCGAQKVCGGPAQPPGQPTTFGPPRPSYQDVGDRNFRSEGTGNKRGGQFAYYRGHTASQPERDAMQQYLARVALPEAIRFARTLPACTQDMHFAVGAVSIVSSRLGTNYELKSICPTKGNWLVHPYGRHYSSPNYALARLRACAIKAGSACASSPLLTLGLADLLDIRAASGTCVAGASYVTPPNGPLDPIRAKAGLVDAKVHFTLTANDVKLLHVTHEMHAWSTDFNNGARPDPPPVGAVGNAHFNYESACGGDETCIHFRRMIDFSGAMDSTYTADEQHTLRTLQDEAHARWMAAQEKGDWCAVRGEDENHSLAHLCAALKDPALEIRPYRAECVEACEPITCQQLIQSHGQTPGSPAL